MKLLEQTCSGGNGDAHAVSSQNPVCHKDETSSRFYHIFYGVSIFKKKLQVSWEMEVNTGLVLQKNELAGMSQCPESCEGKNMCPFRSDSRVST